MTVLEQNLEQVKNKILEEFGKSDNDVDQYLGAIKEWLKSQKHLPEVPCDNMVRLYLIMNKFSVENVKPKIDNYYTLRKFLPEYFKNSNPNSDMKFFPDACYFFMLPKLAPHCSRVCILKLKENIPPDYKTLDTIIAQAFNIFEIMLNEDCFCYCEMFCDLEHLTAAHLMKITPMFVKKLFTLLEKFLSPRIKRLNVVNLNPTLEYFAPIIIPLMPKKIGERVVIHKNMENLYEFLPKDVLPVDYGGTEASLDKLNEMWKQKFVEYNDRYEALQKLEVDESKRPSPLVNDEILGFYGNFKKLELD